MVPNFTLIRSRRCSLALEIRPTGEVLVRAPLTLPRAVIFAFWQAKQRWLAKSLAKIKSGEASLITPRFKPGALFLFLGKKYLLVATAGRQRNFVLDEDGFKLGRRYWYQARPLLEKWYRAAARQYLKARVRYFNRELKLPVETIGISGACRQWGSSNSRKQRVNFSWRLILVALPLVDYVVVHELAHLQEAHHGRAFWNLVGQILPDYQERRRALRKKGHLLQWLV